MEDVPTRRRPDRRHADAAARLRPLPHSVDATRDLFDHMRDVVWVNLLSLPSVALPNGIQIVARRFREDEAFAAARVAAEALRPVTVAEPAAEALP